MERLVLFHCFVVSLVLLLLFFVVLLSYGVIEIGQIKIAGCFIATYRSLSLTIARNAQRSAAVVEIHENMFYRTNVLIRKFNYRLLDTAHYLRRRD